MKILLGISSTLVLSLSLFLITPNIITAFAQTSSGCVLIEVGLPPDNEQLPPECASGSGGDAGCAAGGTGKDGAFQALTPGEQTLFSPWGVPRSGGRSHQGVDLGRAEGTPTFAIEAGVVTKVNKTETGLGGITVSMKGDSGRNHYFAHLVIGSNQHINKGARVEKCQQVGEVGKTGNARTTPPHLHYQISNTGGTWVNPETELAPWPNI